MRTRPLYFIFPQLIVISDQLSNYSKIRIRVYRYFFSIFPFIILMQIRIHLSIAFHFSSINYNFKSIIELFEITRIRVCIAIFFILTRIPIYIIPLDNFRLDVRAYLPSLVISI